VVGAIIGAAVAAAFPPLRATDFIRGDANSDGSVTFADGAYLHNYLYRGGPPPECGNAADYDDNGVINDSDMWLIFRGMYWAWQAHIPEQAPVSPYPSAGPDPTPGAVTVPAGLAAAPCDSYGNGEPLEDPTAEVRVVDAVLSGGDDWLGLITIAMTFSKPIAAYVFHLNDDLGLLPDLPLNEAVEFRDLTGFGPFTGSALYKARHAKLRVTNYSSDKEGLVFPASQDQEVCQLVFCLRPGKAAGVYPLTLEAAELIDLETGRSIHPRLVSGTITILDEVVIPEVEFDRPCRIWGSGEFARVSFDLGEGTGAPGTTAKVPFSVNSDSPLQSFTYSIAFDEEVLQATGTEVRWSRPDGKPWRFERFEINNETGYLVGSAIINLALEGEAPPLDEDVELLRFEFDVHPEAPLGPSEIRFRNGGEAGGDPVINSAVAGFRTTEPNPSSLPFLVNGLVGIVGDISAFRRGDSNDDGQVNISDPIATLGFLFVGEGRIRCPDAADANDDGLIDISDPLATLGHLFNASGSLPPPAGGKGHDPTEDALGCYGSEP
jgi:hypothetical protein